MRLEKWFISNLDDSQRKIIVQSIDEDIIVQGAAGSGKTNLAIHRATTGKEQRKLRHSYFYCGFEKNDSLWNAGSRFRQRAHCIRMGLDSSWL